MSPLCQSLQIVKGLASIQWFFFRKLINLLPVFITNGGEFMSSLQKSPIKHPRPVVPSHQTLESLEISKRMLKTERHRKDQCPITLISQTLPKALCLSWSSPRTECFGVHFISRVSIWATSLLSFHLGVSSTQEHLLADVKGVFPSHC